MSKQNLPVYKLNMNAMKALLSENSILRDQLEDEKNDLANAITTLQNHLNITNLLANQGIISEQMHNTFMLVYPSIEKPVLQPNLTFKKPQLSTIPNKSEELRSIEEEYEAISQKFLETAQKRTDLALEDQKLTARHSGILQELQILQNQYEKLLAQNEKLSHDLEEKKALYEYLTQKNHSASKSLESAGQELNTIQESQDKETIEMLQELGSISDALNLASKKLQNHMKLSH